MYLTFDVQHQKLKRADTNLVVEGSIAYLRAHFDFSTDWDGFAKTALFKGYAVILDSKNECAIPWEALDESGRIKVTVFGVKSGVRITTNALLVDLAYSGYEPGKTPEAPTQDVYDQLADAFGQINHHYKGDYSASETYSFGDVIWSNGMTYWHKGSSPTTGAGPSDKTVWATLSNEDHIVYFSEDDPIGMKFVDKNGNELLVNKYIATQDQVDAMREGLKTLSGEIDDISNEVVVVKNKAVEYVTGKFTLGAVGGKISFGDDASYNYVRANVTGGYYSLSSAKFSNNFSFVTDANDIVLGKVPDYRYGATGMIFDFPENAAHLYLGGQNMGDDFVVLKTREDIATANNYHIDKYPYDTAVRVEIPLLDVRPDAVKSYMTYENIHDGITEIVSAQNLSPINKASLSMSDDTAKITLAGQYGGAESSVFTSKSEALTVSLSGEYTNSRFDINLVYQTNEGKWKNAVTKVLGTSFSEKITVDCANIAVYHDGNGSFKVQLITPDSTGTLTITRLMVYEPTALQKTGIYADKLDEILVNVQNKINDATAKIAKLEAPKLVDENGNKYRIVLSNGDIVLRSVIPQNVVICGNSLVNGMGDSDGSKFGMCASSKNQDFFAYVQHAVLAVNPSATFKRCHTAPFEQANSAAEQVTAFNGIASNFDADTDLIIVQLGDNVNNDTRRELFKAGLKTYLDSMRSKAPNARIIVVGVWFDNGRNLQIINDVLAKTNYELAIINDLNTISNQGYVGQIITYSDGSTGTVNPNYVTHPGDNGMAAIGKCIVDIIGI